MFFKKFLFCPKVFFLNEVIGLIVLGFGINLNFPGAELIDVNFSKASFLFEGSYCFVIHVYLL